MRTRASLFGPTRALWSMVALLGCGASQLQIAPTEEVIRSCVPFVGDTRVSAIESGASFVTGDVRVMDGRVYAEKTTPMDGTGTDGLEIFGFDPRGGAAIRVTTNAFEDRLIDAREGALLYWQRYTNRDSRLVYRDDRGEVTLAENPAYVVGTRFNAPQRARMVRRRRAAFADKGVYFFDGQTTTRLQGPEAGFAQQPDIGDDGTVAWLLQRRMEARADLYVYAGGQVRLVEGVRAEDASAALAVGRGHVYVTGAGGVLDYEVATGSVRTIAPGQACTSLSTDEGRLLLGCGAVSSTTGFAAAATTVLLWENGALSDVPTLGGFVYALRLSGARAGWLEYSDADALCRPTGTGRVVVWPGGRGAPRAIAEVGTPCLCCDAYWPTPTLDFVGDVAAWNYHASPDLPVPTAPLGMAAIRFDERCTP